MPRSRRSRYSTRYRTLLHLLASQRAAAQVTQTELARRMGTTQSMLSKLERGVERMDLMDLFAYLDALRVEPATFIRRVLSEIRGR